MKCAKCGRSLTATPKMSVVGAKGIMMYFGPVCARLVRIKPTRTLHREVEYLRRPRGKVDPRQIDWIGAQA